MQSYKQSIQKENLHKYKPVTYKAILDWMQIYLIYGFNCLYQ